MTYKAPTGPGDAANHGPELRGFRAAMNQWYPARLTFGVPGRTTNVLLLGDSNTVGYNASQEHQTWARLLYGQLADAYGMHAPVGFQPRHSITNYSMPWTTEGTVTDNSGSGLGYGAVNVGGSTGALTAAQLCDRLWVHYSTGTGLGAFSIAVDGVVQTTIAASASARQGGIIWDSGPLQRGVHSVRLASTTATNSVIEGITWFDGNGPIAGAAGTLTQGNARTGYGIRVFNGAKFGSTATDFSVAASGGTWWTDNLGFISPDLVTMSWGTNEIGAGQTQATFRTAITTIMDRINTVMTAASLPNPSYLFIIPFATGATADAIEPYRQAYYQIAGERGCGVIDRADLVGYIDSASVDPYGIGSDGDGASGRKHYSDLGHGLAATHTADYLLNQSRPIKKPTFNPDRELRSMRGAWASRATKPVNLVVLGDSVTQGYYATSFNTSLMQVLMARLCQANGQPVPAGYVPMTSNNTSAYTGRAWTLANVTDNTNYGIGYGAGSLAASGSGVATIDVTCDRFWLVYPQAASGLGAFSVQIDGGAATTITPTGTARGGRVWDSGPLTRDVHTIRVTTTTATAAIVEGAYFFDGNGNTSGTVGTLTAANADTGAGIRLWNAARFGGKADTFANSPNGTNWWTDGFDMVSPDAVFVVLGVNDATTEFENAFHQDLATIITRIRLAANTNSQHMPSIIIVCPYGVGSSSADAMPGHREQLRTTAAEYGASFIDLYDVMGYVGTADADDYGLMSALDSATNKIHPSDVGHQLIGDYLSGWVLDALGPTGQAIRPPTRRVTTAGRTVADGVLNATTTVTSATANFQTTDVGKSIIGPGIPAGTTISARASTTSITLSQAATISANPVSLSIMTAISPITVAADDVLIVNAAAGPADLQMPSPVGQVGQVLRVKKTDNSINPVRLWISGTANKIEDGAEFDILTDGSAVDFVSDGLNWVVF